MEGKTLRQLLKVCVMAAICLTIASSAWAVNQAVVETKDQLAPNSTVDVRVKFTNDVEIATIVCPLMIRSDSANGFGALTAPTGLTIRWRERLVLPGGALNQIVINNTYGDEATNGPDDNGTCKSAQPGGFKAPICDQDTIVDPSCFEGLPMAVLCFRQVILGDQMEAGSDTEGSVLLEMTVNDVEGCFVIDTTCTNPANHLVYVQFGGAQVAVDFTAGYVCVGIEACRNVGLAAPVLDSAIWDGVSNAIDFFWEDLGDSAASYEIELADNQDFTNPFYEASNVTGNQHQALIQVDDVLPFYWRVRGVPADAPASLSAGVAQEPAACIGEWGESDLYTDVKVISSDVIPDSYRLEQNYPNPFNASTVINFTNRRDGHVKLEVFNILGQSVVTLVDDYKPMGVYSVDWSGVDENGNAVPSGMYFYRFTAKNHAEVKKMTLLK
ncbi:MAG: T9SS type A sorting domain-containing protein [candidate division Zixibacteria bacterium]|nr:T9SS type A sorting domain-containing protein [candidate division Zixibacteria bacterium]